MKTILELAIEDYQKKKKELGGLTDLAIKGIIYYVTEVIKISNYKLEILYPPNQPAVIIHVFTNKNEEVFIKLKNTNEIDGLSDFLGIPEYKIKFAERK